MAKVSGQVTLGAVAVAGARLLLLEDTGTTFTPIGITTSDALGEYAFIHDTAVLVTKEYHVICQYVSGVPTEYQALSFPYITPEASADANNFTPIAAGGVVEIGWNLLDLEGSDFGFGLSGVNVSDMP